MIGFPNAKINIGLDILRRRADGYHDIETIFYPVGWKDILEIVPATGTETTLTVTGRRVDCPPEKNLVMKAYRALAAITPLPAVDIHLHKIIPDGAGLGGGSSDAASTIVMLNEMFSLALQKEQMAEIAATIGADCPFFIYNRPMIATGTGTTLRPYDISLKGCPIVIVKPDVSVPTVAAYAGVSPALPDMPLSERIAGKTPAEWRDCIRNDFEPSVFAGFPTIAGIKTALEETGAYYVAMSGSGSAVYAIYNIGDILSDRLGDSFPGCDIFTATLD